MLKINFYDPHYFSTADNFYHGQQRSKVNHFGEKVKNQKFLTKIMTFQKILNSVTSDFSARYYYPTCAWPMLLLEKIKKSSKKFGRGWLFQKSRFLTPQPAKKSWTRSSIDMGPKNLSFSHQNQAPCKELENSIGSFSRTWSEFPRGLYRQQI